MPKFAEDPFAVFSLEELIQKHGLEHLRVRKHGDLLVIESGPKRDPIPHLRLRRVSRQWYSPEVPDHRGHWQRLDMRARAHVVFETVIHEFPWLLIPLA
jgi:hypothetical protein